MRLKKDLENSHNYKNKVVALWDYFWNMTLKSQNYLNKVIAIWE